MIVTRWLHGCWPFLVHDCCSTMTWRLHGLLHGCYTAVTAGERIDGGGTDLNAIDDGEDGVASGVGESVGAGMAALGLSGAAGKEAAAEEEEGARIGDITEGDGAVVWAGG